MRCNRLIPLLVLCVELQQLAGAAEPRTAAPQTGAPASATEPAARPVLTLSDATKTAAPPASASAGPVTMVPKIEEAGATAGDGPPARADKVAVRRKQRPVELVRLSQAGDQMRALLRIKGAQRYVSVGSPVLMKFVTKITDDGVCLDLPGQKNQCSEFISFDEGE